MVRAIAAIAAGLLGAGAVTAQSPLVVDPQRGATPEPLATAAPAPTPLPTPVVAPAPRPTLALPVQPAPAPRGGSPAVASPPGLPLPSGDPLAIDPARDPILALARGQGDWAGFRAAIAGAVATNPAFDEAVAGSTEARYAREEQLGRTRPTVDITFSSFRVIDRDFSNDPLNLLERQRPSRRTDATLRGQLPVIDAGASSARIRAATERMTAAAALIEDAGTQLALRAVAAWYNVYGYRTLVRLGEAFAANQRELRGQVEQRIAQGLSARGDLAQVDGYLASADAQLAEFRRALAGAEAQFAAITGAPPPADLARAPVPDTAGIAAGALPATTDTLPAVRAADANARASRKDALGVRGDLLPQVTVGIDGGRYGVFETANDYDIRGNVTLNWRLGGGGIARWQQANARAGSADARARRVRVEALRDAEVALADVTALENARAAIEANYLASRASRDVLAERFRVARGTLFDVVAAESNFFAVAARYIQTVTELDTARYTLLARTGRLLPVLGIDAAALGAASPNATARLDDDRR